MAFDDFLKIMPAWAVLADGVDLAPVIGDRLLELSVSDQAGVESDQVTIRLDDRGHEIESPRTGAELQVYLGYRESGLADMGRFVVDEVRLSYPPAVIGIRAKGADLGGSFKSQKTRAWEETTLGEIAETIGAEHGYEVHVHQSLAGISFEHLDQTGESDLNFLTRLGEQYDAVVKIGDKKLALTPKGESLTASGEALPAAALTPAQVTSWTVTVSDRGKFESVTAEYHDLEAGERKSVTAGEGEPVKTLRRHFPDEAAARAAAEAEMKRVLRGDAFLELTMPGEVTITAETRLELAGFRGGVEGTWLAKSVTHSLTGKGLTTKISAERPNNSGDEAEGEEE